jgi:hypothetical protein
VTEENKPWRVVSQAFAAAELEDALNELAQDGYQVFRVFQNRGAVGVPHYTILAQEPAAAAILMQNALKVVQERMQQELAKTMGVAGVPVGAAKPP